MVGSLYPSKDGTKDSESGQTSVGAQVTQDSRLDSVDNIEQDGMLDFLLLNVARAVKLKSTGCMYHKGLVGWSVKV